MRFVQKYFILDNMTTKLVGIDSSGKYVNELAKTIDFSKDRKTITIELKRATFSDGSPITAADVKKTLVRASINGSPHTNIEGLWVGSEKLKTIEDDISGIEVISSEKIRLRLNRETKEILYFLTMADLGILHKTQYAKKGELTAADWMSVTSGAYKIEYNRDSEMTLKANKRALMYSESMPQVVTFGSYKSADVIMKIRDKSLDFGMIPFGDYLKDQKFFKNVKGFKIISEQYDGVVFITLNARSGRFSDPKSRQWVQKSIIENYSVPKKFSPASTKANQFFLPGAKGFVNPSEVSDLVKTMGSLERPSHLKNPIEIKTLDGMRYYLPEGFLENLNDSSKLSFSLNTNLSNDDYFKLIYKERDFEASLIGVGMSYKVLGEALNLQYLSENPALVDPTGKIKKLLQLYQKQEDVDSESKTVSQIIKQMILDAECIPLFYFSSPYFVNNKTVKSTKLDLQESVKFYKMVM